MGTVQVMALNPARKGNMGRLNSSQPLYVYDTLIAQPWLKGVIAQIRGEKAIPGVDAGDEKAVKKAKEGLKRQLPIRAIHYSKFRNNHRSSEDAVPESFLFQTTIDVDDVEYVDAALEKARELNCSNTIWKGKLLHLEYSARKKLHIDIRMPMGMTIERRRRIARRLGFPTIRAASRRRESSLSRIRTRRFTAPRSGMGCCRMRRFKPAERPS